MTKEIAERLEEILEDAEDRWEEALLHALEFPGKTN